MPTPGGSNASRMAELRRNAAGLVRDRLAGLDPSALEAVEQIVFEQEVRRLEGEARYRELVQHANSVILRWTRDGVLTFANAYAQRFFGYSEEEMVGQHVGMLLPEQESTGGDLTGLVQDIVEHPDRYVNNVNENVCRDGRRVWMTWTNRAVRDEHGRLVEVLAIGSDITQRTRAEQRLQASNQRLELLATVAERLLRAENPQAIVEDICRMVMEHLDCQFFFNYLVDSSRQRLQLNAAAGVSDATKAEIAQLDFGEAVCGCVARDGQRMVAQDIQYCDDPRTVLVKSYGVQAYCCHPLVTADGLIGTLSFGTRTRARFAADEVALMKSVTDQVAVAMQRLLAEQRSTQQRELLQQIVAGIPVMLVIWDSRLKRFTLNRHAEEVLGWTTADANDGDFMAKVYPDEDYRAEVSAFMQSLQAGWREWLSTTKDGRRVPCEWANIRLSDDTMIGIGVDLRQRKAAEDELYKREERLRASLAEKEVLLKEIHHRVKNNMQVISSLVSLQADQVPDDCMRAVLQDVTHRVRSMALVHEKLYRSADMALVDFADYTDELLSYLWRAHGSAASSIRLALDLKPVFLSVNTAVPCGLILNELVCNALKHAFAGRSAGEVAVSLVEAPAGRVTLSVRDDGNGLPPEIDWSRSRSLGLRLVQMLAGQLHAGVDVGREGGTRFTITFQRTQP